MRRYPTALAAVLCMLCGRLPVALGGAPLPISDRWRVFLDEQGSWRLEGDKGPLLSQCSLRLWTKDGFQTQSNSRPAEPPSEGPAGRAFTGVIRFGNRTTQYWQTVTPVPNGVLVEYAVAASALADTEEVAAVFDLPVPTFGEGTFCVEGGKPTPLPAAKSAEPRLVEQDGATLTVERDGLALSFQRRPAGKIIVQDARHWDNAVFEVQFYARRAAGDPPGWRSVSFLLTLGKAQAAPVIAAVVPGKGSVACGEMHEAEAHFWAGYDNAFDPAQVRLWAEATAPSGEVAPIPGFYTRDYTRTREQEAERLAPAGHGRWRVRITPTQPGPHSYVLKVATPAGTAESRPVSFVASAAAGQPFLHAPKRQTTYLERADGEPCFLIGHNYCWPPAREGTFAAEAALGRMAAAGANATRLWLCSWGVRIEGERPDDYRLDDAWRLDQILRAARERGIYVQLCLDNFQDLAGKDAARTNAYFVASGGPCQTPEQFLTLPKAQEQHRRRLDYLVARYAPFTSLLAWELFNEIGNATEQPRDPAALAWARAAGAYLKKRDPHGHPVTVSVGLRSAWDELWAAPEIDIVQPHVYIRRPTEQRRASEQDAAALVLEQKDELGSSGKPLLIAEFGFLGTRDFNPLNEADKTGVHLHASLWAAALGGCAGTAMGWWWDSYIAERDLYYHYAALASFLRGTPLPDAEWTAVRSKADSPVLVLGYKARDAAVLWLQQRENAWGRRVLEQQGPAPLGKAMVELTGLANGRYRVEWWDTCTGHPVTHADARTTAGALLLRPPARFPDIACKVRRLAE